MLINIASSTVGGTCSRSWRAGAGVKPASHIAQVIVPIVLPELLCSICWEGYMDCSDGCQEVVLIINASEEYEMRETCGFQRSFLLIFLKVRILTEPIVSIHSAIFIILKGLQSPIR